MSDQNNNIIKESILDTITLENFSKLILGTKKSGHQRAVYDIIKDYTVPKKKKKRKKNKNGGDADNVYSLLAVRNKKKKKKKNKHWRL